MAETTEHGATAGESPVDRFILQFHRDEDARCVRPLLDYLALFPGDEDAVAREYLALRDDVEAAAARRSDAAGEEVEAPASGPAPIGARSWGPGAPWSPGEESADTIGRYRLIRELGRGGQGQVHLALDPVLGRQVAVKVLGSPWEDRRGALARFQREAQVASQLDHPGLCPIYEAGIDRGRAFIAMRLIRGESLAARIARTRRPPDATPSTDPAAGVTPTPDVRRTALEGVVAIVEQAARALHVAHEAGIVHRDVKPGNIMIGDDGRPVVTDFGLARMAVDDATPITQAGDLLGTPAYMAPEQVRGDARSVDRRADVWALGATLYEALAGRRPFEGPTHHAILVAIDREDPLPLRRLLPSIPRDLSAIVDVALEKDRRRRYQTALALAEDLRRFVERRPISVGSIGPTGRLVRFASRNRALTAAVLLVFVSLTVGMGLTWAESRRSERERRRADGERAVAERERRRADDALREGLLARHAAMIEPLESESDELIIRSDEIPTLEAWLRRADDLMARRDEHERIVQDLREQGPRRPLTAAESTKEAEVRDAQRANLKYLQLRLADHERDLAALQARLARGEPVASEVTTAAGTVEQNRQLLAVQERALEEPVLWRFQSADDQIRHDLAERLIKELDAFAERRPGRRTRFRVHRYWVRATQIRAESIEAAAGPWREAIARIADPARRPTYDGLRLEPIEGLVPLGPDPESGLEEFAHVLTGGPPARDPATGRLALTDDSALVLVLIPGGTFAMASPAESESDDAATRVTLAPYLIAKHEMNQAQWVSLAYSWAAHHPRGARLDDGYVVTSRHPVESITWLEAARITRLAGLELPTEAQWEFAARAGSTTPWWTGETAGTLQGAANLADRHAARSWPAGGATEPDLNDGFLVHGPVDAFRPNAYGLVAMVGNVAEWCRDAMGPLSRPPRPGDGLREASVSGNRLARGGSFRSLARDARSWSRGAAALDRPDDAIGVRPAMSVLGLVR